MYKPTVLASIVLRAVSARGGIKAGITTGERNTLRRLLPSLPHGSLRAKAHLVARYAPLMVGAAIVGSVA